MREKGKREKSGWGRRRDGMDNKDESDGVIGGTGWGKKRRKAPGEEHDEENGGEVG